MARRSKHAPCHDPVVLSQVSQQRGVLLSRPAHRLARTTAARTARSHALTHAPLAGATHSVALTTAGDRVLMRES
jgi:hypothetical protein